MSGDDGSHTQAHMFARAAPIRGDEILLPNYRRLCETVLNGSTRLGRMQHSIIPICGHATRILQYFGSDLLLRDVIWFVREA